jgi:ABC-type siderophore export system fused ATPase/permease subunit
MIVYVVDDDDTDDVQSNKPLQLSKLLHSSISKLVQICERSYLHRMVALNAPLLIITMVVMVVMVM